MSTPDIVFIGLVEAGQAFAGRLGCAMRGYDRRQDAAKRADFDANRVEWAASNAQAVAGAPLIVSVVTADQALAAAEETARSIAPGALFCDLNSVAPDTKRAAARAIGTAGGRYVDVAVMAPVHPQRLKVPMLVSGPDAAAGAAALGADAADRVVVRTLRCWTWGVRWRAAVARGAGASLAATSGGGAGGGGGVAAQGGRRRRRRRHGLSSRLRRADEAFRPRASSPAPPPRRAPWCSSTAARAPARRASASGSRPPSTRSS